ncbi:TPA: hypothetical protein ACYBJV_001064 [Neisseria meningitidis]|nr:hypothetical protein [Neisseria meningitidis]
MPSEHPAPVSDGILPEPPHPTAIPKTPDLIPSKLKTGIRPAEL